MAPSGQRPVHVVASWQRDAVHVWGWDGAQTMPPGWLFSGFRQRGWPGPPSDYGFHSSLDVLTTAGDPTAADVGAPRRHRRPRLAARCDRRQRLGALVRSPR